MKKAGKLPGGSRRKLCEDFVFSFVSSNYFGIWLGTFTSKLTNYSRPDSSKGLPSPSLPCFIGSYDFARYYSTHSPSICYRLVFSKLARALEI